LAAKIKGNAGFRTRRSVGHGCWVVARVRVHAPVVVLAGGVWLRKRRPWHTDRARVYLAG
jgi:hypothetical protein